MRRQALDDGGWIDLDTAARFDESRTFNGQNRISDATGSQWVHEALYLTREGTAVLHHWSQWQGSGESWAEIPLGDAIAWMIRCGHDPTAIEVGADAREMVRAELAAQER